MALQFEWNSQKATLNYKKHGVLFEESKTVFNDPASMTVLDTKHSIEEDRFIEIGLSNQGRLLVVVYTERQNSLRIISSRKATNREIQIYEQD